MGTPETRRTYDQVGAEPAVRVPSGGIRIRKALRLKPDLNLNFDAVTLVMELLDRIEGLERSLEP